MIVSLNGTIQKPGGANPSFTVSGSTITFASNLATGDVIDFIQILGDVLDLGVPSDATVTAAKIGANAVTAAKLNNDIISGSTELASEPADTDEFLISDAGTLKRIDYSLIKGGGITMADQWRLTADITSNVDPISANLERVDDGSFGYIGTGMSVSSGTWTFPSTGLYQVGATIYTQPNDDSLSVTIQATTNNSSYDVISNVFGGGYQANGRTHTAFSYVNVTNTSNVKVRFGAESIAAGSIIGGNTNSNLTSFNFIRLGDSV
jgi:hypothetical protein